MFEFALGMVGITNYQSLPTQYGISLFYSVKV